MLTEYLLQFALGGAEWVLWLLLAMSMASVLVMLERGIFYARRNVDIDSVRLRFQELLESGQYSEAAEELEKHDETMEARVVLFGLSHRDSSAEAVEDRMQGALSTEKNRYKRYLPFLGTVGSNAPFVGLFGTVLGIIAAFESLSMGTEEAAQAVMAAIAEALVATGVGLLVAIPAVVAFNIFSARVKKSVARSDLLGRTLLAHLRDESDNPPGANGTAD